MATDATIYAFSDKSYMARSKRMVAPADGTYNLIRVPKNSFVTDVWVLITTAYTAGGSTLTVGWSGNGQAAQTAGFITNTIANPTVAGLKRAQHDTLVSFEGKYFYTAGGLVTCTTDDSGGTAGTFWVFATYYIIS